MALQGSGAALVVTATRGAVIHTLLLSRAQSGARAWDDLIREGVVEYLDVNEENSAEIAISEASSILRSRAREVLVGALYELHLPRTCARRLTFGTGPAAVDTHTWRSTR